MPKRSWLSRLIMLLVAVLILPSFAAAKPTTPAPAALVTPGAALNLARQFVQNAAQSEVPAWNGATLGAPTLFETPAGAPSAYVIDLKAKGESVGFVAVSADEVQPRIIEFSDGEAPQLRVAQVQAKTGRSDAPRLIHGGPATFLADFGGALFDLKTLQPYAFARGPASEVFEPASEEAPLEEGDVSIMIQVSKSIAYFPTTFDQSNLNSSSSACGPAAGATIAWYWSKQRGYSKLTSGYSTWTSLGNHMRTDMGTAAWGTSVSGFVSGMKSHFNTHSSYAYSISSVDGKAYDYYASYKSEISNNRPAGVYVGLYLGHDDTYEYHWMPGYGYYEDTNVGHRGIKVATNWGYSDTIDYDYYRSRYAFSFVWIRP